MRRVSNLVLRRMPACAFVLALALFGLITQANAQASTTTGIVSLQNPSRVGDTVEFAVTVSGSGGNPTGTVTLDAGDGTSVFGTLSGGRAKIHHTYATAGIFLVIASYNGDADNLTSVSAIAQTVGKAVTITTLGSLPDPSRVGQPVAFAATVTASAGIPTGTVTYNFGDGSSASGTLAAGVARVNHTYTSVGNFAVTTTYHGDATNLTSVGTTEQSVASGMMTGSLPSPRSVGTLSPSAPLAQQRLPPRFEQ
jgi:Bacterial Ig-like domain (group 3)